MQNKSAIYVCKIYFFRFLVNVLKVSFQKYSYLRAIEKCLFMKKLINSFVFVMLVLLSSCAGSETPKGEFGIRQLNDCSPDSDQYVLIETNKGNIKLLLYRETPLHRKNFVNLVKNGYYDGQLFFRIKKNFMIQAGDPTTRNAKPGVKLGETDVSYKIPAEIDPARRWHKYGALSAASLNPGVESSGSHFCIITGRTVYDKNLNAQEEKYNKTLRRRMFEALQEPYQEKIAKLHAESKKSSAKKREFNELFKFFGEKTDSAMADKKFSYSREQRKHYKEVGGAFHLDGYYTVFGEVVEGMDVVESISLESYDVYDRPVNDVVIKKITLLDDADK